MTNLALHKKEMEGRSYTGPKKTQNVVKTSLPARLKNEL